MKGAMLTFKQFFLLEGGNVVIDDQEATRIDLNKVKRSEIVKLLLTGLDAINRAFEKQHGLPLWSKDLFKSREFLSGSAFHFFNLGKISDEEFVNVKSTVGDIDTQVDGNLDKSIVEFLNANKGKSFGPLTLIGYKTSANQHITLWRLDKYNMNIQIDLELVEFGPDGKPTPWSKFSHSSAWEDLKAGLKGVAHKYLLQALNARGLHDLVIKAKTSRGKDKVVKKSIMAFSVTHGLRQRLVPVRDEQGNHVHVDGLPAYYELSTSESKNITDLDQIFRIFFNREPTPEDLKDMGSFIGLEKLIARYYNKQEQQMVIDGFMNKLWGPGAQGLYRGDKERDYREKLVMAKHLLQTLGGSLDKYQEMIEDYYKGYR
jgi:hypothetical protein